MTIRVVALFLGLTTIVVSSQADNAQFTLFTNYDGSRVLFGTDGKSTEVTIQKAGQGVEANLVTLETIKQLAQTISPEQAAFLYIKFQQDLISAAKQKLLEFLEELDWNDVKSSNEFLQKYNQEMVKVFENGCLELAILEHALPCEVAQKLKVSQMTTVQTQTLKMLSEAHNVSEDQRVDAMIEFGNNVFDAVLEVTVTTLEQHYDLGRAAFGI